MRVKVLGSAAGGGFPQWNCACPNCRRVRRGELKGRARTQAQIAVSPGGSSWLLLNASPDLRQQILQDPEFDPAQGARSSPISSIILTSPDADCVIGLLHLREFQPLRIYATSAVRRIVTEENSVFRTLERSSPPVEWNDLVLERPTAVLGGAECGRQGDVLCRAVPLGGEFPDYVGDALRRDLRPEEAVIGVELVQGEKKIFYAPSLPADGEEWRRRAEESGLAILDGTFWTDDELINVRGGGKTARQMGHLPVSGANGLLEQMRSRGRARRVLIHMNNTNPVLDEQSPASAAVRAARWEVAYDGMEFQL
jgi:pyrroloquinoline quinone biosynthesis protein B